MKLKELILTGVIAGALAACGGGGSAVATTDLTVSGTAATGRAIPGAIITAKCQVGTGTATTIADGTYSLVIAGGQLPCILQITDPADGAKLHTVVTGSGSTAIVNLTPLTEMLTARVLGNEPVVFFAAFDAAVAARTITTAGVKAAQTDVGTILSGTVDTSALGDFIGTPLKAATSGNLTGGDAQDKMLDALRAKLNGAQLTQVVTALAHTTNTADIKQVVATVAAVPPVARAGVAQSVVAGTSVTLDGSASSADLGRTLSYAWTLTSKPAGSSATLSSSTSAKPTFTADVAGTYVATVIVNDGKVNSSADAVSITASVANAAPVANAGSSLTMHYGSFNPPQSMSLDGSASTDANGDMLTYVWTLTSRPAGSLAALALSTSPKPTITVDMEGTYVVSLVVNDGRVNSTAATVTVTATTSNGSGTSTTDTAAGKATVGLAFIDNATFFNLTQQQRLDLVAQPTFDIPAGNSRTQALHVATDTGGAMIGAICETRSLCSTSYFAGINRIQLSDSSQVYLCNGTPGTNGANAVSICVDSSPFPDTVVTMYLTDGRVLEKTLRYKAS